MQKRILIYIFLFSIIITIIIIDSLSGIASNSLVFAISPIFSHQVITDASHDWDISPADSISNCTFLQKNKNIITHPDIESISYFSDGRTLNATLWLSGTFKEKPSLDEFPSYSMLININSFYGTHTLIMKSL